jgi:hypothetical protein
MKTTSRAQRKPGLVIRPASEVPAATPADLARLQEAMRSPIDTSEIPERAPASGGALPETGGIRDAVLAEIGRQGLSRYRLWKAARAHSGTIPESAVYEFLRGERSIGLAYLDAILAALRLEVRPARARRPRRPAGTRPPGAKAPALVASPGRRA